MIKSHRVDVQTSETKTQAMSMLTSPHRGFINNNDQNFSRCCSEIMSYIVYAMRFNSFHIVALTGFVFTILSLISCGYSNQFPLALKDVDSLVNNNPDSAYNLLMANSAAAHSLSHSDRMHYELLIAKAMNKSNRQFSSDSTMKEVAAYYDANGSDNEKMEAHYLLGCVYRDMGEAPVALICYNDAISFADTMQVDCNYATLFRIYGQMATIYGKQHMPKEEISSLRSSSYYANKAGDIYCYIKAKELMVNPYYELNNTSKVLEITDECHDLYEKFGMKEAAASVYPKAILIHINERHFSIADSLIHIFENKSGLFDNSGNISVGLEDYYYIKGLYLLGIHKLNEAESSFRKLLASNRYLSAYDGLLKVYRGQGNVDSVMYFSELREKSADRALQDEQAQAIIQTNDLYNFNRLMNVVEEKDASARRAQFIVIAILLVAPVIFVITFMWYKRKSRLRKEKVAKLQNGVYNVSCG